MNRAITWKIPDILKATKGDILSENPGESFSRIVIDSKKAAPGDLFVAIKGLRFDGHDFVEDAIKNGARGIIVSKNRAGSIISKAPEASGVAIVAVDDTIFALGALAAFLRIQLNVKTIAITGSSGKTTTREMVASVLGMRYSTLSTAGNLNNEIGVPLTLLSLDFSHEVAVIEMGMNHKGEIGRLSAMTRPDIGVITNIGPVHLEGVGGIDGVADAKAEMFEHMSPGGTAVLNADDSYGPKLAERTQNRVLFFGLNQNADIRAENIREDENGIIFKLILPEDTAEVCVRGWGRFLVSDALASAATGYLMGMDAMQIAEGLGRFSPVSGRMSVFKTENDVYVIDDTYNANPDSMSAAVATLTGMKGAGKKILVAGDMLELGDEAPGFHEQIGSIAAKDGVSRLYITGQYAARTAFGARREGMSGSEIFVGTCEDILKDLVAIVSPGDSVLIKGSRAMGMEKIAGRFIEKGARPLWSDTGRGK
ncbi:MAG: UDP-N-acetylmuramoyl-tripeptide--D-alanyl-D-alanine ligase [Deltaproteobacteria bacterium]|nr:UDP-N-acetylmuramoyl-tripeptide--D-alanyl-D-alanine ligase [Deltaproteobacteria bacterium]